MGKRKVWEGRDGSRGKDGKEEGIERRKGLEGGRDGEVEGMGRRKGLGGGRDGEETLRREMCRRDRDDGRTGFVWFPR